MRDDTKREGLALPFLLSRCLLGWTSAVHGLACPGHPDPVRLGASIHPDHRHKAGDDMESMPCAGAPFRPEEDEDHNASVVCSASRSSPISSVPSSSTSA